MFGVELCQLEGTDIAVVRKDIVLRGSLDGEVAKVVCHRIVIAAGINAIGIGLLHHDEPGSRRGAFTILDGKSLVGSDSVAGAGARSDVIPAVAVSVSCCSLVSASIVAGFAEVEVHLLRQHKLLVGALYARHLLYLHAIEIDHDA